MTKIPLCYKSSQYKEVFQYHIIEFKDDPDNWSVSFKLKEDHGGLFTVFPISNAEYRKTHETKSKLDGIDIKGSVYRYYIRDDWGSLCWFEIDKEVQPDQFEILQKKLETLPKAANPQVTQKYFMEWREDFDDQHGWYETEEALKKEIDRIKSLDGAGEAEVTRIIMGIDVSEKFK